MLNTVTSQFSCFIKFIEKHIALVEQIKRLKTTSKMEVIQNIILYELVRL